MDNSNPRRRKTSLQNDYAFCIISPVPASALPNNSPKSIQLRTTPIAAPSPNPANLFDLMHDPFTRNRNISSRRSSSASRIDYNSTIEVGEDATTLNLGPEMNTPSRGFRRWSLSNYQQSGQEVTPSITEAISDFASDEDDESGGMSRTSSSSSMNWFSGMLSNIPARIKKPSNRNKFNVQQQNEEIREQLRKLHVY